MMRSPHTTTREELLLAATRESPCSNEDPAQPKVKYIKLFFFKVACETLA